MSSMSLFVQCVRPLLSVQGAHESESRGAEEKTSIVVFFLETCTSSTAEPSEDCLEQAFLPPNRTISTLQYLINSTVISAFIRMTPRPTTNIPAFYRFYFLWSDPLVCLWAAYMDFFTPDVVVNAFVPSSVAPRNPQHDFLLQQLGGALLMLGFLDVALLRYAEDVVVWKILQMAVLLYDLVLLYSIYYALLGQDRLSLADMRVVEDWGSIAITGVAAAVRGAFLLDVGMKRQAAKRA